MRPKVAKLLEVETLNITRLLQATPKQDKDRPLLMRRLAESYVELAASSRENRAKARFASTKAIKLYKRLRKQYPMWCQFPKNPPGKRACSDEVLKYPPPENLAWGFATLRLANVLEQMGRPDEARANAQQALSFAARYKQLPEAKAIGKLAQQKLDTP